MTEMAEIVSSDYTFTTTVEDPDGMRVTVTAVVPAMRLPSELVGEMAELTQMGASYTATRVNQSIKNYRERCPF